MKALFDVAGTVTSAGSAVLRGLPAAVDDAVVVKNLRAAGAVIVGKTQMTEFAFSAPGTNPHDGTPGNPSDRKNDAAKLFAADLMKPFSLRPGAMRA